MFLVLHEATNTEDFFLCHYIFIKTIVKNITIISRAAVILRAVPNNNKSERGSFFYLPAAICCLLKRIDNQL